MKAELTEGLANTRKRLVELVLPVDEALLARHPCPIMGPVLWDLGHIAAFEELWLVRAVEGWRPEQGGGSRRALSGPGVRRPGRAL